MRGLQQHEKFLLRDALSRTDLPRKQLRDLLIKALGPKLSVELINCLLWSPGQPVAVKQMLTQTQEQLQKAKEEIKNLQLFYGEPNIITMLDHSIYSSKNSSSANIYILFPLYSQSLQEQIVSNSERDAPFEEFSCINQFNKLCEAVRSMHRRSLRHGDIKPHNVVLGRTSLTDTTPQFPLLIDLGSADFLTRTPATKHEALKLAERADQEVSAGIRAPELYDVDIGRTINAKADVWALGCCLYAMIYGPFGPFESPIEGVQKLSIMTANVCFPKAPAISDNLLSLMKNIFVLDLVERNDLEKTLTDLTFMKQVWEQPKIFKFTSFSSFDGEDNDEIREATPADVQVQEGMARCRKCRSMVICNMSVIDLHVTQCLEG